MKRNRICVFLVLDCLILLSVAPLLGQIVRVRYAEGLLHGFLVLRTLDGTIIANGELDQTVQGDRVTSRTTFRFKDGSFREEAVVFSQRGTFRLLKDHLVQRGPTFKQSIDSSFDASTGELNVRYTDEDGKEKSVSERLKVPADFANGMVPVLLKNLQRGAAQLTVPMVVSGPKPRNVKLVITFDGQESFTTGTATHMADRYLVKVEIGGVAGVVAPLVGKQPPDTYVWIMHGDAPTFLRSEGPMYEGGPIWRIELSSPVWNAKAARRPS